VTGRTPPPLVDVLKLTARLPTTGEVLSDVSFAVPRGTFVAIVGPVGCGKSTLLRALAGLVKPTSGSVTIDEQPPAVARKSGAGIGVVFQQPALLPWRTVERNVFLSVHVGATDRNHARLRARNLLTRVDLLGVAQAYPHQLSSGLRMRVALVRALVPSPRLLLLDEPFAALDFLTREDLQVLVRGLHAREGVTTILVTHDIPEAVFLADRVLVLSPRPGMIVADVPIPLGQDRGSTLRYTPAFADATRAVRDRLKWQHA
jgi:NitT/TauT family transport system ATP-binding protein